MPSCCYHCDSHILAELNVPGLSVKSGPACYFGNGIKTSTNLTLLCSNTKIIPLYQYVSSSPVTRMVCVLCFVSLIVILKSNVALKYDFKTYDCSE